ncbi:MAG TPA: PIF1 family DEAD/DEAH box helicase [Candidatus Paceibacterota bacterium]|nr:PIF1 family DEAD/DEAH box helicase [Candidatus Paceibacterota bacterium]
MMTQDEALAIMKTGANVFLTGQPGSGKTHTVNRYVAWLRERGIEAAVTASTGIAATHIGGFTIHSWCGIGVYRSLTKQELKHIAANKRIANRVRKAHVLIIDEISMLSAQTFALADAACRTIRDNTQPFGGLQVVAVGDFFQLPPVVKPAVKEAGEQELIVRHDEDDAIFAFDSLTWAELDPAVCYLSEQHRQEDATFLDLLGALRSGKVSASHRTLLHARRNATVPSDATQLFSHNVDVDRVNQVALAKLESDEHVFAMEGSGPKELVAMLKRGCLSPEVLLLKVDARVIFTKNDTERRFANGTLGIVSGFAEESGHPIVKTMTGANIVVEPEEWSIDDGPRILATVKQFPLRLAWAITVHKSQGMSLDAAHMDLSRAFEYGQGYVALSRVRTLAGLSLAGFNERALEMHPGIAAKDAEFREQSLAQSAALANISKTKLGELHAAFIKKCGGSPFTAANAASSRANADMPAFASGGPYAAIRQKYPKAYMVWSDEEDADLAHRHASGEKTKTIAEAFARQPSAIRSRLAKLGLIVR